MNEDKMLDRVRALLAKAESTEFDEEAEALTAKAQQLILRHAIDAAQLARPDEPTGEPERRDIEIIAPYVKPKFLLLSGIASANRSAAVLRPPTGNVVMIGYADDLDAIELLFTSLLLQATRAMLASGAQSDARGKSRTRSFRHSFLMGFASRISQRLAAEVDVIVAETSSGNQSSALPVLAKKSDSVEAALAEDFPRLSQLRMSVSNSTGIHAGVDSANRADLRSSKRRIAGQSRLLN